MAEGSTSIVIFGATGDLTQRKLLPALFNLRCKGHLPSNTNILGFSRTPYTDGRRWLQVCGVPGGGNA